MRYAEFALLLLPLAAWVLWRIAQTRGLDGPEPRQIAVLFAALLAMAVGLAVFTLRERSPPGRYVPPELRDGQVVPGRVIPEEPPG